jgi:hypothetical protein
MSNRRKLFNAKRRMKKNKNRKNCCINVFFFSFMQLYTYLVNYLRPNLIVIYGTRIKR